MNNKKIKIQFDIFYNKEHYNYILTLLHYFQDIENGLQQRHFRYALMKKHGLGADSIEKMEEFFKKYLQKFYSDYDINRECIGSRQKLTNYLTALLNADIINKDRNKKYTIAPRYLHELRKRNIISYIDKCPVGLIRNFGYPSTLIPILIERNIPLADGFLFGVPANIREKLNKKENQNIDIYLLKIIENLINIDILTKKYTKDDCSLSLFVTSNHWHNRHKEIIGIKDLKDFKSRLLLD